MFFPRFARRKLRKFQRKNSKRSSAGLDVDLKVSEMRRKLRVEEDQDVEEEEEDGKEVDNKKLVMIENCSYGDYITCSKGLKKNSV